MTGTTSGVRKVQMVSANVGTRRGEARIGDIVDHQAIGVRQDADAAEE